MSKVSERKAVINNVVRLLREERLRQGLSQNETAARAGLPNSTVLRIENGTRLPSLETALAIADALGVDLGYLISQAVLSAKGTPQR